MLAASLAYRAASDDDGATASGECAAAGVERPLPAEFPRSFPLPAGARPTEAAVSAAGSVFVRAYVPMSAPEAVVFFRDQPRARGWTVAPAREVEGAGVTAGVRRPGVSGTWTVDEVPGCPATTLLTVRLRRT